MPTFFRTSIAAMGLCLLSVWAQDTPTLNPSTTKPRIPPDLLGDDHVKEEFGVNQFTSPSIARIFEDLRDLGEIPYKRLSRKLPDTPPRARAQVAVHLGMLIADGLVSVHCEKSGDLEPIGRALLGHAKILGAGREMNRHTKSLLEHSVDGDWKELRKELTATQTDVEKELVLLRDADLAHLISLGGWLRAFQIGCEAASDPFSIERTAQLARPDVAAYYREQLNFLEQAVFPPERLKVIQEQLFTLEKFLVLPEDRSVNADDLSRWQAAAMKALEELMTVSPASRPEPESTKP